MDLEFQVRKQFLPLIESNNRWFCVVAHRRAGKTCAAIQKLVISALTTDKGSPRFAFIAPMYKQAKTVAWDYLKHMTKPLDGIVNESELRVDMPNGSRIRLFGADNPDSLRGQYLDGVVMDEVAQMPMSLWSEVIRPALSDRQGWAYFSGTPKGKNTFWDIWQKAQDREDWTTLMLKASETSLLNEVELAAAKKDMSEAEFAQEYECSFEAAIRGAYYGKEMAQAKIQNVPYDPILPVITSWDLGISDSTVIWMWQINGAEIRAIDLMEFQGIGLPDIVNKLKEKNYNYSQHILPHDCKVRELGTGKSREEVLISLGVRPTIAPNQRIEDGINAFRNMIPRIYFDKDNCKQGIEALKQYRTEYDEKRQVFKNNPLHDWTSHFADAARYFAITNHKAFQNSQYDDWSVAVNV